ncbi:uncharacterized protein EI90DRAFT_2814996, partial [Cantharellus anzutake]|uniref:uncharacterized protein n=1 Tax=Cantharellus anzutake TaxID=1750568 RepID=UPI0019088391
MLGTLSELCLHAQPNATHHLLVHLFQLKLLCRSYTQNVDDLDAKAGLPQMDDNGRWAHVTLHGSLKSLYNRTLMCDICSKTCMLTLDHITMFKDGMYPECTRCIEEGETRIISHSKL